MDNTCATCARRYDQASTRLAEKPLLPGRHLPCCGRSICTRCLNQNKRYETYCPYCQITTEPSLLPQGLRDPPAYSSLEERVQPTQVNGAIEHDDNDEPPAYSSHPPRLHPTTNGASAKDSDPAPDVLHFLTPNDSIHSLGLAYGVPMHALRKTNNLYSDGLLQGRRTLLIPGEYYKGGVSLSPRPLEGEEEEAKKQKVRRWMVGCKVVDISPSLRYDVALLYLNQSEWDLDTAIAAYKDDERWEREHPLQAKRKGKSKNVKEVGMRRFVGGTG